MALELAICTKEVLASPVDPSAGEDYDGCDAGVGRGLGVGEHLPVQGVDVGVGVADGVGVGVGPPVENCVTNCR